MEKVGAVGFAASAEKPNGSKSIASLHYEDAIEPLESHEQARRRLQLPPAQYAQRVCQSAAESATACAYAKAAAAQPVAPPPAPGFIAPPPSPPPLDSSLEDQIWDSLGKPPPPPPPDVISLQLNITDDGTFTAARLELVKTEIARAAGVSDLTVRVTTPAVDAGSRRRLSTPPIVLDAMIVAWDVSSSVIKANLERNPCDGVVIDCGGLGTSAAVASQALQATGVTVVAMRLIQNRDDCPGKTFDNSCDDGGAGSSYALCACGTDNSDCAPRTAQDCVEADANKAAIAAAQAAAAAAYVAPDYTPEPVEPAAGPTFEGEACYQQRSIHVSGR